MCLYEFDVELHEKVLRREEREDGIKEGLAKGRREGEEKAKSLARQVFKAYLSGKTPEAIAIELDVPLEEVEELVL